MRDERAHPLEEGPVRRGTAANLHDPRGIPHISGEVRGPPLHGLAERVLERGPVQPADVDQVVRAEEGGA